MVIVPQPAPLLFTLSPFPPLPLLAAPPKRLALPAPQIRGLLPAPKPVALAKKRVTVEIIEQPRIDINIYENPQGWWDEFERIFGRIKSIEEMDAELEAKHPGYLAWVARMETAREVARL